MEICRDFIKDFVNTDGGFLDYQVHPQIPSTRHGGNAEHLASNDVSVAGATGDETPFGEIGPFYNAAVTDRVHILQFLFLKAPREILRCCRPLHPIHLAIASRSVECMELIIDHSREGMTK